MHKTAFKNEITASENRKKISPKTPKCSLDKYIVTVNCYNDTLYIL